MKINTPKISKSYLSIAVILIMLCFVPWSLAIGVAPGEQTFVFNGDAITYDLRIVNDEQRNVAYDVNINGELAPYVKLSKESVIFSSGQTEETISVRFFIPPDVKVAPDEYVTRIVIREKQTEQEGIVAFMGVISKLIITVPGDAAYVKTNLFAPNFIKETSNSFSVDVTNKGVKTANNCMVVLDISTQANAKVTSLISEKFSVEGTKTQRIFISWTPNANNGKYLAKASVVCDGASAKDEKLFDIGSPEVLISTLSADDFTLGEINKFNVVLSSEWGEPITNVYADVELMKGESQVFSTKTESKDFAPLEKVILPLYIDTRNLPPGEYSMNIMLHYLDKDVGEVFKLIMTDNNVAINRMSGLVVGGDSTKKEEVGGLNALLVLAIIVVVVINVVLVMKLMKKRKNK